MSLLDNIKRMINPLSDEDDDYDELFDEQDSPFLDERPRSSERGVVDSRRGKVVNIHATTQLKVVLVKPERFEAASEIADHLKEKRTVVVNLESTHKDIARRLIDFLSGVAYMHLKSKFLLLHQKYGKRCGIPFFLITNY